MKKALITGCLGQDGSYLAEHLLSLGYEVWGTVRMNAPSHAHHVQGVHYEYADLQNKLSIVKVLQKVRPDEIYNLAGQVFVPTSWINPADTFDVNVGGLARIMDCLDQMELNKTRVYQASTSEMFGNILRNYPAEVLALSENNAMCPVSPYGVSKLAAHKLVDAYRQRGFFVSSGILFNHESPRRGMEMVTRKIAKHVAMWANDKMEVLKLGTVEAKRDWGFAGDYVKAMHLMLQQDKPEDFVVGTGVAHSIMDFVTTSVSVAGLDGINLEDILKINCPEFGRKSEVYTLVAQWSKAHNKLGWEPETSFKDLVSMMVEHESILMEREMTHV